MSMEDLITCPKCGERFASPYILPCQHSVCLACARICTDHVGVEGMVTCPECSVTCHVHEMKRDINKEQLLALCADEDVPGGSQYDVEDLLTCDVCGDHVSWRCADCSQWLCATCQRRHSNKITTNQHSFENVIHLAKQHRNTLETQYDIIRKSEQRLHKYLAKLNSEIKDIQHQQTKVLHDCRELREEWLQQICQHFDNIEKQILSVVTERMDELLRIRDDIEVSHNALLAKTNEMKSFLSQMEPFIISHGAQKTQDTTSYLEKTSVPKLDFKKTSLEIKRGVAFDASAAATLEIEGHCKVTPVNLEKSVGDRTRDLVAQRHAALKAKHGLDKASPSPFSKSVTGRQSNSRLSLKLAPIPNASVQHDSLRHITKATSRLQKTVTLTSKPVSLTFMKGNLWCVQTTAISVWTLDLAWVETVQHEMLRDLQAARELASGNIVVATGNGLHLLTKTARYDARITDECYVDVVVHNGLLYAVTYGAGYRAKVHVYDEVANTERIQDDSWHVAKTITLPCDGYTTIHVADMVMYVCSVDYATVYVITPDGDVIRRCGHKGHYGGAGELTEPRLCHVDWEGSLLISDSGNARLQVLNSCGDWAVVALDTPVRRPSCAYFRKRQLYVTQPDAKHKLFKFYN